MALKRPSKMLDTILPINIKSQLPPVHHPSMQTICHRPHTLCSIRPRLQNDDPKYSPHTHPQPRVAKEGPPRQPTEPGRAPVAAASPSRHEAEPHFPPQASPLDEGARQRAPQHVVSEVDDLVRGKGVHTLHSRREGQPPHSTTNPTDRHAWPPAATQPTCPLPPTTPTDLHGTRQPQA